MLESWSLVTGDPPNMCCSDDDLCAACALDSSFTSSHRRSG